MNMNRETTTKNKPKSGKKRQSSSPLPDADKRAGTDEHRSYTPEREDDHGQMETEILGSSDPELYDSSSEDEEINQGPNSSVNRKSIIVKDEQEPTQSHIRSSPPIPSKQNSYLWKIAAVIFVILAWLWWNGGSDSSPSNTDWRTQVDPNNVLSSNHQNTIYASLKPILDKSATGEGVSTLLILSSSEETAATLGRCLLRRVNTNKNKDESSTVIDLKTHSGGKLQLDRNLRSLLSADDGTRAVLLRHIDDNLSSDTFDRARLLFAYCDGENPVIPHRLIIMTATSSSENELRKTLKTRWSSEHDFVDALMSRITGHTLYVEEDQGSIC